MYVLRGLVGDYNFIITNITKKKTIPSLVDVFNALRIHKKQLECQNRTRVQLIQPNMTRFNSQNQGSQSFAQRSNQNHPLSNNYNKHKDIIIRIKIKIRGMKKNLVQCTRTHAKFTINKAII